MPGYTPQTMLPGSVITDKNKVPSGSSFAGRFSAAAAAMIDVNAADLFLNAFDSSYYTYGRLNYMTLNDKKFAIQSTLSKANQPWD